MLFWIIYVLIMLVHVPIVYKVWFGGSKFADAEDNFELAMDLSAVTACSVFWWVFDIGYVLVWLTRKILEGIRRLVERLDI